MARDNNRSPSPAGSSYSKRSGRRDDDRQRSYRRRSRSRSLDRRDRDTRRRRDRSYDRRDDGNSYRPGRRDRSRERRRSRTRSPVKDRGDRDRRRDRDRDRDRDRIYNRRRDESRDRHRARRDDSPPRRKGRPNTPQKEKEDPAKAAEIAAAKEQAEKERQKAERLAKLEAWKAKQAAERKRKEEEAAKGGGAQGTRALLAEMDKKEAGVASPSAESAMSPALPSGSASPAPYAGKFDPKAIARKAAGGANNSNRLGDVNVPHKSKGTFIADLKPDAAKANGYSHPTIPPSLRRLKAGEKVSGFELGAKPGPDNEKIGNKTALDFDEEETTRKKLEKLPQFDLTDAAYANTADIDGDEDDDVEMGEAETEEEAAAAARIAAEKRDERLQHEIEAEAEAAKRNGEFPQTVEPGTSAEKTEGAADDEVDPLDAFMATLGQDDQQTQTKTKKSKLEPEAMFNDEDMMDAVDEGAEDILALTKKKKKEIPTIKDTSWQDEPFRKNFYREPQELAEMTDAQVAQLRHDLDGIATKPSNTPKPANKWGYCALGAQVLDVIQALGFEKPTPIQAQAMPIIMSGYDMVGVAKTGSGKTLAYLLPMFRHINDQRPLSKLEGPIGLVLTPTRELATQVHRECKPFLKALQLRAVCAYGGAPIRDQIDQLKAGAEICVCTPGRMIDLLTANAGRVTNLRRVTYVVLDEADRMFDMGFAPQVRMILAAIRPNRQTVMFSATYQGKLDGTAREILSKDGSIQVLIGGKNVVPPEITQIVEVRDASTKFRRLLELLGELYSTDEDARTLVFVERKEAADVLFKELLNKGYPCQPIHGDKEQIERDQTIADFKSGALPILIATSVAARGLDVKQLKLVVNFDCPSHTEDYVHRAGRTGRAGNKGTAVTFITPEEERFAFGIIIALKESKVEPPKALARLSNKFNKKYKEGEVFRAAGGFGGKGLQHLTAEREASRKQTKAAYKQAGGGGDEDDEDEEEEVEESPKKPEKEFEIKSTAGPSAPPGPSASAPPAKELDFEGNNIVVHKTERPAAGQSPTNPLDRVRAAVANIDNRLTQKGQLRHGQPIDNKGPDAGAFHATLEINDYPQKARWAVTNRTNVAKILEATGTSITTKGSYHDPTSKNPPPAEPKLYILVEGDTEIQVRQAMTELYRYLREATIAAADIETKNPSGRYSVV
ncbi:hypothetical protein BDY21DRAFT_361010 [Lineolata rhizophorae]|uniref:RNA helicase n=1 Tax=Lineolata rhizophorae TaxID=578093 RepID=A0A6A6PAL5_9PEZI|nr:hypothetical protein BDY21DRAFT_361010 [Lineolata rhizophorae]